MIERARTWARNLWADLVVTTGRVREALVDPARRFRKERQLLEAGVGRDEARVVAWLDLSDDDVAGLIGADFAALRANGVL